MNIIKTQNLSFYNEQGILTLTAKQFDTGRMFVFHIIDNDVPFDLSGCTAYLRIAKADGTQFQGHECCTVEGSQIIISTSAGNGSQILAAAGTNVCELHLKDANDIGLTTWTFHIVVEPRVHDGIHMSSIDSYDVLDNMINMEKERIANEEQRKENEKQRKESETNRNTVFEEKIEETNAVITDCHLVIDAANQKISSFDAEINEIVDGITDEAQSYADNAKASETNAANSASSAADSAATASQKAGDAAASAVLSQSYAVGGTGTRDGEDADNAKEYAKQAQEILQNLQRTTVTGVKGNSENTYRTGDVNITPDNIGLGNVNNTSDENKPVSNAQRTAIDAKVSKSGDTMNGNLEMTNHSINNVLSVNGTVGGNDFWRIAGGDTGSNAGYVEIATADDGTEPIYVRQYTGVYSNKVREATLLDANGNTSFPGRVTAPVFQGQATNADVAAKLGTASVGSWDVPIYLDRGIPRKCEDILNLYHEAKSNGRENRRYLTIKSINPYGGYNFLIQYVSVRPLSYHVYIGLPYSYPLKYNWRPILFATNEIGTHKKQIMSANFSNNNTAWIGVECWLDSLNAYDPIYDEEKSSINIMVIGVI